MQNDRPKATWASRPAYPPVIEHQPSPWFFSMTGRTWPGASSFSKILEVPSNGRQPKFAPRPSPRRTKSTSSTSFCPTSAIVRSPVRRSNEKRHGLRSP